MAREAFLPALRELVRCYQAFEAYSAAHVRSLGLTPPQFDIIATLGNTEGMTFKELGEKTLITKGTLTGVVDRLAARRLVRRVPSSTDGRSSIVQLTAAGEALFDKVFPRHMAHLKGAFARFSGQELGQIEAMMLRLREALTSAAARARCAQRAERNR